MSTKTWQEKFDEEFNWEVIFGKNSKAQNTVKQFIADLITQTREETIRETLKAVEEVFPFVINDNEKNFVQSLINLRK